ncbi:hypothetical protein [Solidesulfovibrio sp.]
MMGRQLTPAEMRRIDDAFADLKEIIKTAKLAHAAKRREARKCTSKSAQSKSPERVAA